MCVQCCKEKGVLHALGCCLDKGQAAPEPTDPDTSSSGCLGKMPGLGGWVGGGGGR